MAITRRFLFGSAVFGAAHRGLGAQAAAEWIPLFDGKTLKGWKETPFRSRGEVLVKDSTILIGKGHMTGITWTGEFPKSGYEIRVEAARMDNAKGWSMLWNIILPQLRPATFIAMVVTVIGALRSFDLISIMTVGGPYGSTRVLSYFMYEQALSEYGTAMGYGAAIAVVLFAIMLVFISIFIVRMLAQERNS